MGKHKKYSDGRKSEVSDMKETKYITIPMKKNEIVIKIDTVLYVFMERNIAEIHASGDRVYKTRMTLSELEDQLGDGFIKVHRGCLVSAMAIHEVTDKIHLINGETLDYVVRKKKEILTQLYAKQKKIISSFNDAGIPKTEEEYHVYYRSFDTMPFAFTDIEMVFDEERRAVDWIFRYGNSALARLEKLPLDKLIGSSFGSLFSNMDSKWLRSYECVTLYGETLEIIDYSPEIDTYLDVICFPTFKGHCGCLLFDISEMKFSHESSDSERAMMLYFGKLMERNNS